MTAAAMTQANAGDDGVLAAGKQAQHGAGVIRVRGFFENLIVDDDDGVGAQHDFAGALPGRFRLGARQAPHVIDGAFARATHFFHRLRAHREMESGDGQQFAAARRLRC